EVIAGSTRMKAGTAQKAVLNLLSTAIMVRLGLVYDGRMVAMRISNAKLLHRGRAMVRDIAGVDDATAADALAAADNDIRVGTGRARMSAMRDMALTLSDADTPLYLQLARRLREHIDSGAIDPGGALPSERDLSEMAGLSRVTVRKGIE
ncbi:hypothetical protein LTR94_030911, partial [Friedmanniomyces endolithicus]